MQKTSTMRRTANKIFKGRQLTIGMDLGDRWSFYCVLDESGGVLLEDKLATTPEAMKQTFAMIPRSRIALETGTHSPWVSRLLTQLGHEVIVAHAQKVFTDNYTDNLFYGLGKIAPMCARISS